MIENNTTAVKRNEHIDKTLRPDISEAPVIVAQNETFQYESTPMSAESVLQGRCPNCGAIIDSDADYCEACFCYIRKEVCSFCGSYMGEHAAYCPECGNPRAGITCPTCNTVNKFSFCTQCGNALTDEAKYLVKKLQDNDDYRQALEESFKLAELNNIQPYISEQDAVKEQQTEELRIRVLTLLAHDSGIDNPVIEHKKSRRMASGDLESCKEDIMKRLDSVLEKLATKPSGSPAKARNYAMASKPSGLRLAWLCNYKHAMHSSPCGCAKPHLGGRWIILGKNNVDQIKDDKQ